MEWLPLLKELGIFSIAGGFITYLLNNSSNRKLEAYKAELSQEGKNFQASLDAKLEAHKTELRIQSYKSTKVYEQQLAAIIQLHSLLTDLHVAMLALTSPIKQVHSDFNKEEFERISKAADCYNAFIDFFNKSKIFFPADLAGKIQAIQVDYYKSLNKQKIAFEMQSASAFITAEMETATQIVREIQNALQELTIEFQNLIGLNK